MRLDPLFHPMPLDHLGHCYVMLGNDKAALAPLRECVARALRWRPARDLRDGAAFCCGRRMTAGAAGACD